MDTEKEKTKRKNIHEYRLFEELIKLSVADYWDAAVLEWEWVRTFYVDYANENCLCGHDIAECCVIKNKLNGNEAIVGNCCINKFIQTDNDLIFQALKRVRKDPLKSFNVSTINQAQKEKVITDSDWFFYAGVMRKRNLETNEINRKLELNQVMLRYFIKSDKEIDLSQYKIVEPTKEIKKLKNETKRTIEFLPDPVDEKEVINLKYAGIVYHVLEKFVNSNKYYDKKNRIRVDNGEELIKDISVVYKFNNYIKLFKSEQLKQVWIFDFEEPKVEKFTRQGIRCFWFKCNENINELARNVIDGFTYCCEL